MSTVDPRPDSITQRTELLQHVHRVRKYTAHILSGAYTAARLLEASLEPLIERDDDADVTLPATALHQLLETLTGEIYEHRVILCSLCSHVGTYLGKGELQA